MNDQNQFADVQPAGLNTDPKGDYQEYTGPTHASETPKPEPDSRSIFGSEILTILEGFGEDIKRLSKNVSEYLDKESFNNAAGSVRDALNDAGEGIKRTTQNLGEKLEEERIQRAIRELKDYAKKTEKSISDIFKEEPPAPAEDLDEPLEHEEGDTADHDINFDNTFGG